MLPSPFDMNERPDVQQLQRESTCPTAKDLIPPSPVPLQALTESRLQISHRSPWNSSTRGTATRRIRAPPRTPPPTWGSRSPVPPTSPTSPSSSPSPSSASTRFVRLHLLRDSWLAAMVILSSLVWWAIVGAGASEGRRGAGAAADAGGGGGELRRLHRRLRGALLRSRAARELRRPPRGHGNAAGPSLLVVLFTPLLLLPAPFVPKVIAPCGLSRPCAVKLIGWMLVDGLN